MPIGPTPTGRCTFLEDHLLVKDFFPPVIDVEPILLGGELEAPIIVSKCPDAVVVEPLEGIRAPPSIAAKDATRIWSRAIHRSIIDAHESFPHLDFFPVRLVVCFDDF